MPPPTSEAPRPAAPVFVSPAGCHIGRASSCHFPTPVDDLRPDADRPGPGRKSRRRRGAAGPVRERSRVVATRTATPRDLSRSGQGCELRVPDRCVPRQPRAPAGRPRSTRRSWWDSEQSRLIEVPAASRQDRSDEPKKHHRCRTSTIPGTTRPAERNGRSELFARTCSRVRSRCSSLPPCSSTC